jgi:hypothetical protein
MPRSPSFTDKELDRAMKVAVENSMTLKVLKRAGECEITFVPVDQPSKPSKGAGPRKW